MAVRVNAENFDDEVLNAQRRVLADFYSDSCVPCKRMSPVLAELEETYGQQLTVGKVNIAYETDLVQQYEVTSAPTFLIFQNGEVKDRFTGVVKKEQIEEKLNAVKE